ncbi:MAG: phage major capsid protein [Selenomonadaceae bacterium]|nr:phage major capsid protein [Selenomonadaceae bacterium]
MEKIIKRLEQRKAELTARAEQSTDVDELRRIHQQLATINEDLAQLNEAKTKAAEEQQNKDTDERTAAVNSVNEARSDAPKFIQGKGFIPTHESRDKSLDSALEQREKAGNELKENHAVKSPLSTFGELRAVTVTPASGQSATIVVPSSYSSTINPDFPVVSSLVDAVAHLSLNGGESFTQPYITDIDTGNYTNEGATAAQAETHFDYAEIHKTKITAYAEITEELERLPSAAYADVVFQNIRTSMRKLLTKEILVGAGGTNQIVGIFNSSVINVNTDLEISAITDTTLDEILFRYGNDEDVESPATLIVSKLDLLAFSKVRTATKQKFYDIQLNGNGNSGTISGVPFIINSACKSLMTATDKGGAAVGDYCMAYGSLSNYLLVEFSPLDVRRSDDYKFPQGMSAFRGVAFFGGNCVRQNAFLRVKKASA